MNTRPGFHELGRRALIESSGPGEPGTGFHDRPLSRCATAPSIYPCSRCAVPKRVLGIGVVVAGDSLLDDTYLPALRSESRSDLLGKRFGWSAENRMLGYLKLALVAQPRRLSAQVLVRRQAHRHYDPQWSLDGYSYVPPDPKASPVFSPVHLPGYQRYRAADHMAITDVRSVDTILTASTLGPLRRVTASLGWLRTRTIPSIDGREQPTDVSRRPSYGNPYETDQFHVLWGNDALDREAASDAWSVGGDYPTTGLDTLRSIKVWVPVHDAHLYDAPRAV